MTTAAPHTLPATLPPLPPHAFCSSSQSSGAIQRDSPRWPSGHHLGRHCYHLQRRWTSNALLQRREPRGRQTWRCCRRCAARGRFGMTPSRHRAPTWRAGCAGSRTVWRASCWRHLRRRAAALVWRCLPPLSFHSKFYQHCADALARCGNPFFSRALRCYRPGVGVSRLPPHATPSCTPRSPALYCLLLPNTPTYPAPTLPHAWWHVRVHIRAGCRFDLSQCLPALCKPVMRAPRRWPHYLPQCGLHLPTRCDGHHHITSSAYRCYIFYFTLATRLLRLRRRRATFCRAAAQRSRPATWPYARGSLAPAHANFFRLACEQNAQPVCSRHACAASIQHTMPPSCTCHKTFLFTHTHTHIHTHTHHHTHTHFTHHHTPHTTLPTHTHIFPTHTFHIYYTHTLVVHLVVSHTHHTRTHWFTHITRLHTQTFIVTLYGLHNDTWLAHTALATILVGGPCRPFAFHDIPSSIPCKHFLDLSPPSLLLCLAVPVCGSVANSFALWYGISGAPRILPGFEARSFPSAFLPRWHVSGAHPLPPPTPPRPPPLSHMHCHICAHTTLHTFLCPHTHTHTFPIHTTCSTATTQPTHTHTFVGCTLPHLQCPSHACPHPPASFAHASHPPPTPRTTLLGAPRRNFALPAT